jgi:hypothetical protein
MGHDGLAFMGHRRAFVDLLVDLDRRALVARGDAPIDPGAAGRIEARANRGERLGVQTSMAKVPQRR